MSFWNAKRVFVTGHTGFKGSWLSLLLTDLGAHVTGYALEPDTQPSMFELCNIKDTIEKNYFEDIRERETLKDALQESQPEIVIHMAAQSLVQESYVSPVETYSTNVMGTVHLLDAIRSTESVRSVIIVTTDKCYEDKKWIWGYRESDRLGGFDPYSNSKACTELVTQAYRNSFFAKQDYGTHGVALASARAGNVIGGGDWADKRLIPDCVQALIAKKPIVVRNPDAVRPWQHVLEPLSGYLLLAQQLYEKNTEMDGAWNFGPLDKDMKPVSWIVDRLTEMWDDSAGVEYKKDAHEGHETHVLKLDSTKSKNLLGWEPRWSLEKTLEKIVEWSTVYAHNGDISQITLQQIHEYFKDVE